MAIDGEICAVCKKPIKSGEGRYICMNVAVHTGCNGGQVTELSKGKDANS